MSLGPTDPPTDATVAAAVPGTTDPRLVRLLDAVLAVSRDLDLDTVLGRVVEAACALVDARYGALGVISPDGDGLSSFVHRGIDDDTAARIGSLPSGRGILGLLIEEPTPLRLDDLTAHERSFGFPEHHPPMHGFLGTPIRVRDRAFGNLYLAEKRAGGRFTAEDEDLIVGLAAVAGAAIENARLYDDLSLRETWRDAVLGVSTSVLTGATAAEVRDRIVTYGAKLVQADAACIVGTHGDGLWVLASTGDAPSVGFIPADHGPAWATLLDAATVRGDAGPVFGEHPSLWVPLRAAGELVAAFGVSRDRPFGDRDEALLGSFAEQAALALSHERAQTDLQRMSLIEDRERIGRDLHDTVIQRLFATGLSLQASIRRVEDRPEIAERLERAVDEIDLTVKEIRSTIFALQHSEDTSDSVRNAVLRVVDEIGTMLPRSPRVRFDGPIDSAVPTPVANELVPVVRETLTNVAKHAGASQVELELTVDGAGLELRVVDDGRGIPSDRRRGFGLGNLGDRAAALGGELELGPGRGGQGTTVRWRVPLR